MHGKDVYRALLVCDLSFFNRYDATLRVSNFISMLFYSLGTDWSMAIGGIFLAPGSRYVMCWCLITSLTLLYLKFLCFVGGVRVYVCD